MEVKKSVKLMILPVLCSGLLLAQGLSNPPAPSNGNQSEEGKEESRNEQGRHHEENTIPGGRPQSKPSPVRTLEPRDTVEGSIVEGVRNGLQNQSKDQKDETATEYRWHLWKRVRGTLPCILTFLDSNGPIIMVIATIIMTVFTTLFVCLTWIQHKLNKEFLGVSKKFFYMANRPRLRIRDVKCPRFPKISRDMQEADVGRLRRSGPKGYCLVINVGGSVATPIQMYIGFKRTKDVRSEIKFLWRNIPAATEIGIGEHFKISLPERRWSYRETSIYYRTLDKFHFFGGIRYKDAAGATWETGFVRKYDTGRGFVDDGRDFEY